MSFSLVKSDARDGWFGYWLAPWKASDDSLSFLLVLDGDGPRVSTKRSSMMVSALVVR
jgi:hypothetical protein